MKVFSIHTLDRDKLISAMGAVIALMLTLFLLLVLNMKQIIKRDTSKSIISFDIKQVKQKKVKPKKKVKRKQSKTKKNLKPKLSHQFQMSGVGLSSLSLLNEANSLGADDVIMDAASVDTLPEVFHRTPPDYPVTALRNKVSGYVKFKILIDQSGSVIKTQVLDSVPDSIFDMAATNAIMNWKFSPGIYQNKAVKVWIKQKIVFSLD